MTIQTLINSLPMLMPVSILITGIVILKALEIKDNRQHEKFCKGLI